MGALTSLVDIPLEMLGVVLQVAKRRYSAP